MKNYVITIARGFGSRGRQIALRLGEELGIPVYDNALWALAARYSGYEESLFPREKLSGSYLVQLLSQFTLSPNPKPARSRFVSDKELFDIQSELIRKLAETESCIIVGKCADWVLREYQNVLSIYVEAPRECCVKNVMDMMPEVTEAQAHELIHQTDQYRSEYYRVYTGGSTWDDVLNYDLTINTGRLSEDQAICLIIDALDLKFPVSGMIPHEAECRHGFAERKA